MKLSIAGTRKLKDGKDCSSVKVIVRDSGIGIPKKELANIFNRFYRVNRRNQHDAEGTGIGLELAKRLVQMHLGTIEVQSTPGAGIHVHCQLTLDSTGSPAFKDTRWFEPI